MNFNTLNVAFTTSRSDENENESFANLNLINKIQIGKIIGINHDPSSDGDIIYQMFSKIFNLSDDEDEKKNKKGEVEVERKVLVDSNSIPEILRCVSEKDMAENKLEKNSSSDEKFVLILANFMSYEAIRLH